MLSHETLGAGAFMLIIPETITDGIGIIIVLLIVAMKNKKRMSTVA
ncbi:hypothetical protein J2Z83_002343 [Virgibacillus natechei]|uniref:Uncharacterized protein n=1 Tax=Virgibacillus natechei TaxID=1216297 RepID=A0ABS4IH00_9BACI|nr:hypothetical protein [Virgibacillus natechei]MBP1970225.1 hypothetical protein [Virgibacillus natechei]UZD12827.1 hypothetical protein OLD84_18385 [Virgibacillus natechei]